MWRDISGGKLVPCPRRCFYVAGFMNLWGQATRKQYRAQPLRMDHSINETHYSKSPIKDSLATKRVGPVGDHWANSNDTKMETYSFYVTWPEMTCLQSKIHGKKDHQQILPFESICPVVWKSVAKAKHGSEVSVITICRNDTKRSFEGVITNKAQTIKVVKTDSSVQESSPMELVLLIMNQGVDDQKNIEVALYELDTRGQMPVYVNCAIDDIGDEGVVLVFPARKDN